MYQKDPIVAYLNLKELFYDVRMRLYHLGEMLKRKDPDLAGIQAGEDEDSEILMPFVETAINRVKQAMLKRVGDMEVNLSYGCEEAQIFLYPYNRIPQVDAYKVADMLRKSIHDYAVNLCMAEFLTVVSPQHAVPFLQKDESLLYEVTKCTACLGGLVKRRPTNLAGI